MIKDQDIWTILPGNGPLLAAAIHNGHHVSREALEQMAISEDDRLREEDPFTGDFTLIGDTRIIARRSRFEFDLNRPRGKAVYLKPEDSWGLKVWESEPGPEIIKRSLEAYDAFNAEAFRLISAMIEKYGPVVVFDLHSYNYRRKGPGGPPDDPMENPEINIGTGTMDRDQWASLADRFISDLQAYNFQSRRLDVRENIKFRGGNFSRWIHDTFPGSACSLSIEIKKFFMDEWTGEPNRQIMNDVIAALQSTVPGILEELKKKIS